MQCPHTPGLCWPVSRKHRHTLSMVLSLLLAGFGLWSPSLPPKAILQPYMPCWVPLDSHGDWKGHQIGMCTYSYASNSLHDPGEFIQPLRISASWSVKWSDWIRCWKLTHFQVPWPSWGLGSKKVLTDQQQSKKTTFQPKMPCKFWSHFGGLGGPCQTSHCGSIFRVLFVMGLLRPHDLLHSHSYTVGFVPILGCSGFHQLLTKSSKYH